MTINNNPIDPKVARFLSAIMKVRREKGTQLASSRVERILDVTRDKRVDLKDYYVLKSSIKARWFTPALFKGCVGYINAVPRGAVKIEKLGKAAGGGKLFYVELSYAHRKNLSVRIEMMKGNRLKMSFLQITWKRSNPTPIDYKPMYVKTSYLEIEGFKFKKVRGKMILPAGMHKRLNKLASRAKVKRTRRSVRRAL